MKRCAVITFGCKVNQYESQALQERIRRGGFELVGPEEDADVYVLNTCTVTETAYAEAARVVRRIHRRRPSAEITVTGCAADSNRAEFLAMAGVRRVVLHDEKSALPLLLDDLRLAPEDIKPSIFDLQVSAFEAHTRAFLKIQDGCDLRCSFCIIPQVRGASVSRPFEEAVEEAERLAAAGYREIVLTGVHVGSFGKEIAGHSLIPDLVERMLAIPGLARVRLSSIEANEVDDRLIEVMRESGERFCPHFHLPLQSGDEEVLRDMRRRYNPAQFLRTVDRIRARVEEPAFTTDVIVGFPTETDAAFDRTLEFCRRVGFSRIHIFPYSHRRGTDASALPDLPASLKKARLNALRDLAGELTDSFAAKFIGREVEVLVEESGGPAGGYTERYLKATLSSGTPNEIVRARAVAVRDGGLACA
ncbi:MAG TPA: tRNA (N(6)-L-threonylcarbamoyladenosine(37)-C(2))-methylthiotransferase MtaB [Planctomycetota bacterium]|nr:tRNA (N(6)-L-threonylcarbamoyladenosine(37)-C(2))-methylthiotransferase MtaB [Planctomycetota bacterium]